MADCWFVRVVMAWWAPLHFLFWVRVRVIGKGGRREKGEKGIEIELRTGLGLGETKDKAKAMQRGWEEAQRIFQGLLGKRKKQNELGFWLGRREKQLWNLVLGSWGESPQTPLGWKGASPPRPPPPLMEANQKTQGSHRSSINK